MLRIVLCLLIAYALLALLLYLFQRHMIYFPEQDFPSPQEAGVPEMSVIHLNTSDDLKLKAWYRAPTDPNLPTVVYFHGNAGHIGYRAIFAAPLLNQGYGVLLLTYRGYSGNPGKPTEEGLYGDARAALDFLLQQEVRKDCLILYGNSIGTAVAIKMATEYEIRALVLQSPFTSLGDVAHVHYPFFPVRWGIKDRYDSLSRAPDIQVPTLILHGASDRIVPPKLGQKLFEALPDPKEAHFIPHADHNTVYEPDLVNAFIEKHKCS